MPEVEEEKKEQGIGKKQLAIGQNQISLDSTMYVNSGAPRTSCQFCLACHPVPSPENPYLKRMQASRQASLSTTTPIPAYHLVCASQLSFSHLVKVLFLFRFSYYLIRPSTSPRHPSIRYGLIFTSRISHAYFSARRYCKGTGRGGGCDGGARQSYSTAFDVWSSPRSSAILGNNAPSRACVPTAFETQVAKQNIAVACMNSNHIY